MIFYKIDKIHYKILKAVLYSNVRLNLSGCRKFIIKATHVSNYDPYEQLDV